MKIVKLGGSGYYASAEVRSYFPMTTRVGPCLLITVHEIPWLMIKSRRTVIVLHDLSHVALDRVVVK